MKAIANSRLFLLAAASLTALAACGGGGGAPDQPEPAATNTTPATPPAAHTAEAPPPDSTDTVGGATLAQFTGDAAAGEQVFVQCQTCHVTEPGVNRIGPSLAGIVGRPAGQVAGFTYTPANADSGITWTPEQLFQYLENPQRVVPGTKMAFAGIADPQARANLIAWLGTQ